MASEADELVAGILSVYDRFPGAIVRASRRGEPNSDSCSANVWLRALDGELGDAIGAAGLPEPDEIEQEGDAYSASWYRPLSWLDTLRQLNWHQMADVALIQDYPECCGPPSMLLARSEDSKNMVSECVVCQSRWSWEGADVPDLMAPWNRAGAPSPSAPERKEAFAPYLGQPPDELPDEDDLTPMEQAIVEANRVPGEDHTVRFWLALGGATLLAPGHPRPDGSTGELRPVDTDQAEPGAALVAFTRPAWLHLALWWHPEWFAGAVPVEVAGEEIQEMSDDQGVSIWINPEVEAFELLLDPPEAA